MLGRASQRVEWDRLWLAPECRFPCQLNRVCTLNQQFTQPTPSSLTPTQAPTGTPYAKVLSMLLPVDTMTLPTTCHLLYRFELGKLQHNHNLNFCASLLKGMHTVIVDNTNIQQWHFERYVKQAEGHGYVIGEEVVGKFTRRAAEEYAERCVHQVPLRNVMQMLEQWWEEQGGSEDEDKDDD